ncbi:MAG: acyl-CoA dehydrogenase family protein [Chloroflexota bacterium]
MNFDDTQKEAAFRAEARAWLEANVPQEAEMSGLDEVGRAQFWQKRKSDGGWACITWPEAFGGRGANAIEQVIFDQEEAKLDTPYMGSYFSIGQGMAAPTIMTYGTPEMMARFLPKLASGEEIWCQLFSEPSAGSDLAGLRTKAEKDGDEWVVNGQKVWTTVAQHASYAILVVRTDPSVPKHKGMTYFLLDMHSPGIEVRPIKQISGGSSFNEVYLTDVRIPDSMRLGKIGQGWRVALTTLMNERASIGGGNVSANFETVKELAKRLEIDGQPAIEDSTVRSKLASWYVEEAGLKFTEYRTLTALSKGEEPGPESSIGKLVAGVKGQDMASFAIDLLEQQGIQWDPEQDELEDAIFVSNFMNLPGLRIAGGTDEIMLNIIAERVLGLPPEPRVDKTVPFSEVPTGT